MNIEETESPQSPHSMPLTINDQEEEQIYDNTLLQIHQSQQMDVNIDSASLVVLPSVTKKTTNTKKKFSKTSNIQHTALKNVTNNESSLATTKGKKRKIPSSPKPRKISARLAAKRNQ